MLLSLGPVCSPFARASPPHPRDGRTSAAPGCGLQLAPADRAARCRPGPEPVRKPARPDRGAGGFQLVQRPCPLALCAADAAAAGVGTFASRTRWAAAVVWLVGAWAGDVAREGREGPRTRTWAWCWTVVAAVERAAVSAADSSARLWRPALSVPAAVLARSSRDRAAADALHRGRLRHLGDGARLRARASSRLVRGRDQSSCADSAASTA